MNRIIALCLIVTMIGITVSGCGDRKVIGGVEYDTYGLLNQDDKKNPDIQYEVIWGNIFWGIVLSETIIVPIYVFGFSLFEPVGPKMPIKGQVAR